MSYYVYIDKRKRKTSNLHDAYQLFISGVESGAYSRILDGRTGKIIAKANVKHHHSFFC